MDEVKIEKGIDIKKFMCGAPLTDKYSKTLLKCEVGDSFLIPDKKEDGDKARTNVSHIARRRGWRIATRFVGKCSETGLYQRRVWRVE
jgi:hypothetical protein